jgi:hypothetical protein
MPPVHAGKGRAGRSTFSICVLEGSDGICFIYLGFWICSDVNQLRSSRNQLISPSHKPSRAMITYRLHRGYQVVWT